MREFHIQNHFNHDSRHEGLGGEFKDRLKTTRGLKDEDSAPIKPIIIHHDFFREHSGPNGMMPAGIMTEDARRWEAVIADAAPTCARLPPRRAPAGEGRRGKTVRTTLKNDL